MVMCSKPTRARSRIFEHLNRQRDSLRKWVFVLDEAHRFADDANVRSFITEAGKFCKKVILITADWKKYEGLGTILRLVPISTETGLG